MIKKWIESIFIKRAALSLATGAAAYLAAHGLPAASYLSAFGVDVTIQINPERFADACAIGFMAMGQGFHEWIAHRYPELGKYL